jgi:hypothetical protein
MPSTITDRLNGTTTSVAVKAPCVAVATTNITQSGEQVVGGVSVVEGDRVLCNGQTDPKQNGILVVSTGTWSRALDFNGARDAVQGTLVLVQNQFIQGAFYELTTANPVVFGSSNIAFTVRDAPNNDFPQTTIEIIAGVVPTDTSFAPGDLERYGADASGVATSDAALDAAWAQQRVGGPPIFAGVGTFRFDLAHTLTSIGDSTFTQGPIIRGAGEDATIFDTRVANNTFLTIQSGGSVGTHFLIQSNITDLKITNSTSAAANNFMTFKVAYKVILERLYLTDTTGTAISIPVALGDTDACTWVEVKNTWIHNCRTWGMNAIPDPTLNQTSFLKLTQVWFQNCGTAMPTKAISAVSKANPCVVTAASHGFSNGDRILITQAPFVVGVGPSAAYAGGMTELSGFYRVSAATTNTFVPQYEGSNVNSTAFTTYTGTGLFVESGTPTSGALGYKGQILELDMCAFTINQNRALYIPGNNGLSVNLSVRSTTFENNRKVHVDIGGIDVGSIENCQFYNNTLNYATRACVLDGTDNLIRQFDILRPYVRAETTSNPYTAFEVFGLNAEKKSIGIHKVGWSNFDFAGQRRIVGFRFPNVIDCCTIEANAATVILYRPRNVAAIGNTCPVRLAGPVSVGTTRSTTGEWIEEQISTGGLVVTNAGLANSTRYEIYVFDNAGTPGISLSTTGSTRDVDAGYMVKSDDATRRHIGSCITNGSAQFVTTAVGYLNPEVVHAGATQTGIPYYRWRDGTGALRVANSIPIATDTSGTLV